MADHLEVRTIAEGVENSRHAVNMVCNGCRYIQGNYLMEPAAEEDFLDLVLQKENKGRNHYVWHKKLLEEYKYAGVSV